MGALIRKPVRAVSLGEAIVAIFLILASIMVTITLFHASLRYGQKSESRTLAAIFGRKVIAEIRAWARVPQKYDSDWSELTANVFEDEDFPNFKAQLECDAKNGRLTSPCSEFERLEDGARAYRLERAVVPIKVTVSWGSESLILVSQVGEPLRELAQNPVVLTRVSGPNPMAPNDKVTLRAELHDSNNRSIPGIRFFWSSQPGSKNGNGTIIYDGPRAGNEITFQHLFTWNYPAEPPQTTHVPGLVPMGASCRYGGRNYQQDAPLKLHLQ